MKLLGKNKNIPVWGTPQQNAVDQMDNCIKHPLCVGGALMADHHLGYAVPVGGVIAYRGAISPSAVGFDISCGNKAVLTDLLYSDIHDKMGLIMDKIFDQISFGVGQKSKFLEDHILFDDGDPAWDIPFIGELKDTAYKQLGTVGAGNHYVDLFRDELDRIWIGVHFGSRGLGHKIATHYIKAGGGTDGINVDPVVLLDTSDLGAEYIIAMNLAGRYAYAGRDRVCNRVMTILSECSSKKVMGLAEVHNHHNFAWKENHSGEDLWVVRKGATPAFPGQFGFVGGTMGENSVILSGFENAECSKSFYSTVHGAGRVMSRTQAAGKTKWGKGGKKTRVSTGEVSQAMMDEWVNNAKVVLRGGGVDESPHCYKRLDDVLEAHSNTTKICCRLTPIGVAMADSEVSDPFKD